MPADREEIQKTLAESQEKTIAYYRAMSLEDLERPCTESGVPGEVPWRPKDHLAHLTANEQGIQSLLRLALEGNTSLLDSLGKMSDEERLVWSNQRNQAYVNEHRNDTVESLFAQLADARQATLALLAQSTDEQLAGPGPVPFGADRTLGDMFNINSYHEAMHKTWIEEGIHQGL
jgi:hypothetical protein